MDTAYLLRTWSERLPAFIVGGNEAGMKLGGDIRAADVAVWARRRRRRAKRATSLSAADSGGEVAGEDEDESALTEKARWYLGHGVGVVWLVLPETREVVVIRDGRTERFGRGESLSATESLPGLEPEVARFFAQIDR